MKSKHTMLAYLIIFIFFAMSAIDGYAQAPIAAQNLSFATLSAARLAEIRQKWETVSEANLLTAAKAGDASAQYFYWARKWQQAYNDCQSAADRRDFKGEDQACERGTEAFEWLKRSAEQGFPPAEYDAAIDYLGQRGWKTTDVNQQKAIEFLQRSADHNWGSAQYKLGMLYVVGELLPPDLAKAVDYLQKVVDQGAAPRSEYELAQLYAAGIGEPRSAAESPVALLRQSATNGFQLAWQTLGERYRTGLGLPVDYIQAIRCYYKAAHMDHTVDFDVFNSAQDNVGDVFNLVDDNLQPKPGAGPNWTGFARVLSVYLKATRRADAEAMNQLGELYLLGEYVPHNPVTAYYWFDRAAAHGGVTATQKRDALKAKLRPDQLEQAAKFNESKP